MHEDLDYRPNSDPEKVPVILELVSQAIDDYNAFMAKQRDRLAEIVSGKALLVVDSAFGVPTVNIQGRLKYLRELDGQPDVAQLVLEKFFGGTIPQSTTDVFRLFFGPDVDLVHHDIRHSRRDFNGRIGGVIFTGSPANVDITGDERLGKYTTLSHRDVFERLAAFHKMCMDEGIPVLGFCFGFHLITKLLGGEVKAMEEDRYGIERVSVTGDGSIYLAKLFGEVVGGGDVYVSHGQQAFPNVQSSMGILEAVDKDEEDCDVRILHGSISVDSEQVKLGDSPWRNAAKVKQILDDGGYASLGLQSHPEIAFVHMLLQYLITNASLESYQNLAQRMTFVRYLFSLITDFLGAHRKMKS